MNKTATITLIDQVNCRITNVDPGVMRKLIGTLEFMLPHAKFSPKFKLGRWNGKVSFMNAGGHTQSSMLERVLPVLDKEGFDIELIDQRVEHSIELPQITADFLSEHLWPDTHPMCPGQPIILAEHQVEVANNFFENHKGVQVAPTSAGKTLICAALCKAVEPYGKTITIVPNKGLVTQTQEDLVMCGLDAGIYFGDHKDWGNQHMVCTWQSLSHLATSSARDPEQERTIEELRRGVVAVIVDECHSSDASVLRNLLTRVFNDVPLRWGLTGTMPKDDYKALSIVGSIGPLINTLKATTLQDRGVLSKCEINVLQVQDESKFKDYPSEYKYLINDSSRVTLLAQMINNIGTTGNTLVLVQNISVGKLLCKLVPGSVFISGAVKVKDRADEYKEVATADNKIIIATYGVASTGVNIPRIFNLVLFEAGKSFIKTVQSIGRSLRRAHDKDYAMIFDVCSSTKYSKRHLAERKKFYKEMGYPFQMIKLNPKDFV